MVGNEFFGNFDLASAAIWLFWVFFRPADFLSCRPRTCAKAIHSSKTKMATQRPNSRARFLCLRTKQFILPHGRGEVTVPSGQRGDRASSRPRPDI